jgi:signal transduction histidine kinase
VLKLVVEKIMTALDLPRLVLLWHPPDLERAVDAYTTAGGSDGARLELGESVDLAALCPAPHRATVTTRAAVESTLPESIARALVGPDVLCLPLVFKSQYLGLVLASLDCEARPADLDLAGALASQAAAALANAGLFETARRHEAELRKLSQVRVQLQEESLRSLSRELHDGVGQVLTAIKMDLGMIERATPQRPARAPVARPRGARAGDRAPARGADDVASCSAHRCSTTSARADAAVARREVHGANAHRRSICGRRPAETRLPPAIEVLLYRVTQERSRTS